MQTLKIEVFKKISKIISNADDRSYKSLIEALDFICEEFEFYAAAIFKLVSSDEAILAVKSSKVKDSLIDGKAYEINLSTAFSENLVYPTQPASLADIELHEISTKIVLSENDKFILKVGKKSKFVQNDFIILDSCYEFLKNLLKIILSNQSELPQNKFYINQILIDLSSEFRSQLNNIIGFSSILTEDDLSAAQVEYVKNIKNNVQNLYYTLNDLIEIAKLELGKTKLDVKQNSILSLFDELKNSFAQKKDVEDVDLQYEAGQNLPNQASFDFAKLKNLLLYGVSYYKKIAKTNKILIKIRRDLHSFVVFAFMKNDISKELNLIELTSKSKQEEETQAKIDIQKIFLYKLTESLNGEVEIVSADKDNIYLYIKIPLQLEEIRQISADEKISTKFPILLLSKEESSTKLIVANLRKWNFIIDHASDLTECVNLGEKNNYLAIIIDSSGRDLNSLEAVKNLRRSPKLKNLPIFIFAMEPLSQKTAFMGPVEYFVKPVNYKVLVETLNSYKLKKDSQILCVDDDITILNLLKETINNAGYQAIIENKPMNALTILEKENIELAIIDLDMPEMDGYELIIQIKTNSKFEKLPILIYTGKENYETDLDKIKGMFDEILSKKNQTIEDLAQTISKFASKIETPTPPETIKTKKDVIKILLAEDYKHSQIIVTRLLKKNGFENVVVAENGEQAVNYCKQDKFDLILMDMQMPVMSGFEAMQKLREMDEYKDTPIIALTAFAMKGDKERCLEAGATDYIPKPIDSKEFIEKVKYYTDNLKRQ